MKKLNNKGISVVEVVLTFTLIMTIVSGILTIIMNYRARANIEMERLELVTYKNTLTKEIQNDILTRGLHEINYSGDCENQASNYGSCINLSFKDGTSKILAVSKLDDNNIDTLKELLNNKYIKYGDTKYPIEDKLPDVIPTGRSAKDFQNIYINNDNILSSDSLIQSDGTTTNIYSIDIYIEHIDYDDDFGIHIVATNNDTLSTSMVSKDFIHTGDVQEYTVSASGTYKLELWGASGGNSGIYTGGMGAYASGYIYLEKGKTLYLNIGGAGEEGTITGGYNGGESIKAGEEKYGSPGGGATDIRITGGTWDNFDSLKTRIIVASGGGGANNRNTTSKTDKVLYGAGSGGSGGGLIGYDGESVNYSESEGYTSSNEHGLGTGATAIQGGSYLTYDSKGNNLSSTVTGGFGKGLLEGNQSGAGGGWFTGGYSKNGGAGGGSSYISGHNGCQAIDQVSTSGNIKMLNNSEYSEYHFDNTTMIDGEGYLWTDKKENQTTMPTYEGKTNESGNKGNGHIRITYLGL